MRNTLEELEKQISLLERRFSRECDARKEAEKLLEQKSLELYETNQLLRMENLRIMKLIQSLPVAMVLYDQKTVIAVNPSFESLFGESPEGRSVAETEARLGLEMRDHPEYRVQHEIHKQGETHEEVTTVLVQYVPLIEHHTADAVHETLMVAMDISDRIKNDEVQQYAAFQAGIAEMSASILHNIGNIVTGMHGSLMHLGRIPPQIKRLEKGVSKALEQSQQAEDTDLVATNQRNEQVMQATVKILSGLRGEEKMVQYIDKLELGIHHIGEIIQLQQKAARPDTHITSFNFPSMLNDTLSLIQDRIEKYNIEVVRDLDPKLQKVELPRNPMIQMVMNFIKNSMEAVGERLLEEYSHQGKIEIITAVVGENSFKLTVRDNGCGIYPDRLEKIFVFGETNKEQGSGYGLHSAANFVRSLNGKLYAESDGENSGAAMIVQLPIRVDR